MHIILSFDVGVMLLGTVGAFLGLLCVTILKAWRDDAPDLFDEIMFLAGMERWLWLAACLAVGFFVGFVLPGSNSILQVLLTAAVAAAVFRFVFAYILE